MVVSITPGNPTIATLDYDIPPTLPVGANITISGAAGAGCAGLNGTFPITGVSGADVTFTYDSTGCTYTASSGVVDSAFYWVLPTTPGNTEIGRAHV